MQSRSGIARSGATRSNYYAFTVVVSIDNNGTPVDVSKYVAYNSWHIGLNLNDEVDTATLSLLPTCPFVPQTRSQVKIGFGSTSNLVFAGIVLTVQRTRRPGPDPRFWYDLSCVDWTALLDAHFIHADYPTQSATTTVLDIVARFTKANISVAGVASGLPSLEPMSLVNERPSTVFRRIANKLGGGFFVDTNRVLRLWSGTIQSPIQDPDPQPLTDDLSTLKTFRMTEDASQQRTRVFVEGRNTTTVLGVPAGLPSLTVPVQESGIFTASTDSKNYARFGSSLSIGPQSIGNPSVDASNNPPGTKTVGDLAIGAPFMQVEDASRFPPSGWLQTAGQILQFVKGEEGLPGFLIPTSGYGSLQAPVSNGTQVVALPWASHNPIDRLATSSPIFWGDYVPSRIQPQGSSAVVMIVDDDRAVAATIGTREGSDGFYEHLVQDGRYSAEGCRGRAAAELADFKNPLITYEWETEDFNAEPGRMQHIALTDGTPITDDVRITNVEITPTAPQHPPRRMVRASKVITAGVVDIWVDDAS